MAAQNSEAKMLLAADARAAITRIPSKKAILQFQEQHTLSELVPVFPLLELLGIPRAEVSSNKRPRRSEKDMK